MLTKTRKTIKEDVLPKIANILPSLRPKGAAKEYGSRISDLEEFQKKIIQKLEEDGQLSGAFDHFHQTTPTNVTPNVLQQLYGRDLHFMRKYYQTCSPIDQLIFGKRFEQLRALSDCVADNPKKVGWRVVHKRQNSPDFKATKETEQKCRWFELLIQSPSKVRHPGGFPDALIAMGESKMLFDRIPIEKLEHRKYQNTGLPASYLIPDAATIKPTVWVLHAMAGSSGYSGKRNVDQARSIAHMSQDIAGQLLNFESPLMQSNIRKVAKQLAKRSGDEGDHYARLNNGLIVWVQQMPDNLISAGYTEKDLSLFIGNPSPQVNAWGWSSGSAFERSFAFGEVIFKMTGVNQELFDSRMPEGVLSVSNAGVDKRAKQQMHERMMSEGLDRFGNLLVQFVTDPEKDIKYQKLKDKPTEMQFRELFTLYVKLKCAAYGFDYTELNLEDGRTGGQQGAGAAEKRMEGHAASGVQADTRYYAHCLTEALISPWSDEFKMEFVHDVSETQEHIELQTKKLSFKSIAETRQEENLPMEWWEDVPDKEQQEKAKEMAMFFCMPGLTGTQIVQLVNKKLDQDMQREMAEQEQQQPEGEAPGEELPEEEGALEQGVSDPKYEDSEELANLKSAIGQLDEENQQLEQELEKSFVVRHFYN